MKSVFRDNCRFAAPFILILLTMFWSAGTALLYAESAHSEPGHEERASEARHEVVEGGELEVVPEKVQGEGTGDEEFSRDSAKRQAIDVALVLDASGSMKRTDPERLRDQGAKLLSRFLGADDRLSMVSFDRFVTQQLEFKAVTASIDAEVDGALKRINNDGGFTDIELAIEKSAQLLEYSRRKEANPIIVLLSDGRLDPYPSRGTVQQVEDHLFSVVLPGLKKKGIAVYTLAFSDEADKSLLRRIAEASGGMFWSATDANTIHEKFSELFLGMKRPQMVELTDEGFEIDESVSEATFYVNRKTEEEEVTIVDPLSSEIDHKSAPGGYRWYRGKLFDVITISAPLPGHWSVSGVTGGKGFATLVTDLKLEVVWPKNTVSVGEKLLVKARMLQEGEAYKDDKGLKDLMFYTYKLVDNESGSSILRGKLLDTGADGDEVADDGVYSVVVQAGASGEFTAMVGVTTPTFSRQQQIPFQVSDGLVSLSLKRSGEGNVEDDLFEVLLSSSYAKNKDLKVVLAVQTEGQEKVFPLSLVKSKSDPLRYTAKASKLTAGKHFLSARVKTVEEGGKEKLESSKTLEYEVEKGVEEEVEPEVVVEEEPEEEVEESSESFTLDYASLGAGCGVAILLGAALIFYAIKSFNVNELPAKLRTPYSPPPELATRIDVLAGGIFGKQAKKPAEGNREMFVLVETIFRDEGAYSATMKRLMNRAGRGSSEPSDSPARASIDRATLSEEAAGPDAFEGGEA
ncbi:MAG: VWA domain-containing protein [bacterium]|nr:VWA domain-containing protein [bacterium]